MYIEASDIETFLNITLSDFGVATINEIIPAVEVYTESYCNRKWSSDADDDITEKFDGGTDIFTPSQVPVASITSITVNGQLLTSDQYYNYRSYIRTDGIAIDLPQTVVIVYRTGATSIPADLKHALVRWISEIFKSQDHAGKTVSRVSMGSVSIDFLAKDGVPAFVQMVLDRYRLTPL